MTVLVIGAALSGRAATDLLRSAGERVVVYDLDPSALDGVPADRTHGGAWDPAFLEGIDVVVASPGVPEHAPPIQDALAAGVPLWSELELASRHLDVPIAAITGTNGKTTVTGMTARMLQESGVRAYAVGNIGEPLSAAVGKPWDALVVEASSFQLRFVESFHAEAAVLLNVAPDHLDWHGSFEAYASAKARVLERQTADDVVAFDADDPGASSLVEAATGRRVPVSGSRRPAGGWGRDGDRLVLDGLEIELADLPRTDAVMLVDVAAAAVAAARLGATADGIRAAAIGFTPVPHRREVVGVWDGVTWVDDSKATNPHATIAAIRDHDSVVLIAGGRNKGLDVGAIPREPNLRLVVAIGEAAADLAATGGPVERAASLEEAVAMADAAALSGDTVLLAPGCASFDMFHSYADRGERFAALVRSRKEI